MEEEPHFRYRGPVPARLKDSAAVAMPGTVPDMSRRASHSGAGVRFVVDAAEAAAVDMAVKLRSGEGAVAKEVLDRAQVGAALQQVRCESMAQTMRVREHAAHGRRIGPPPSCREKQSVLGT